METNEFTYFTAFSPTFPAHDSPNRGTLSYFTSLWTKLSKISTRSAKFSYKNSRIFISKDDKRRQLFRKMKNLLNHMFLRPILPTKYPSLRSGRLVSAVGLGNPVKFSKLPCKGVVNN